MSAPLMSYVLTGVLALFWATVAVLALTRRDAGRWRMLVASGAGVLALEGLLGRVFWEWFLRSSQSYALAQLVTVLEMAVTLLGLGLVVAGAFSGRRSTPGLQGGVPNPYGR